MGINWVTFWAQIVNLFILIWLLKKFLYRPILETVKKRQSYIMERIKTAERKAVESQKEYEVLSSEKKLFEKEKQNKIDLLEKELSDYKKQQKSEIKDLMHQEHLSLQESLNQETTNLSDKIATIMGKHFILLSDKILNDLGTSSLFTTTVQTLIQQIEKLSGKERKNLSKIALSEKSILVISSSEISENLKKELNSSLKKFLFLPKNFSIIYEQTSDLILGTEIYIGNYMLEWNLKNYLDSFSMDLKKQISQMIIQTEG